MLKNGGDLQAFSDSFKDGKFLERLADDVKSTFDADEWENAYGRLRGIEMDAFDDARDVMGSGSKQAASTLEGFAWAKKMSGAADTLGYWGDACDIAESGGAAIEKALDGDFLGAVGEVGYGAVKFLGGKGITALAGFAVGGPAGVVIGVGVETLWDWGCEAFHDGKLPEHIDAFVDGARELAEDVGDFFTDVGDFFGGLMPDF